MTLPVVSFVLCLVVEILLIYVLYYIYNITYLYRRGYRKKSIAKAEDDANDVELLPMMQQSTLNKITMPDRVVSTTSLVVCLRWIFCVMRSRQPKIVATDATEVKFCLTNPFVWTFYY